MKCLVIGSPHFLAPRVIDSLLQKGHKVSFFSTWSADYKPPPQVDCIMGDTNDLPFRKDEIKEIMPDSVIMVDAYTESDAACFVEAVWGFTSAWTIVSSANVYRAHGRLRFTEPGQPDRIPLAETSPLRGKPIKDDPLRDKRFVEKRISDSKRPATYIRLPAVYGPRDYKRRLYPIMQRMVDKRHTIVLGQAQAAWKWTHGYVDDMAHAIALAATNPSPRNRTYNVGEVEVPTTLERIESISGILDWHGQLEVIPDNDLPDHLKIDADFRHHWVYDSSLIRKELGYEEVVDYHKGLRTAVEWYADHPPQEKQGIDYSYDVEQAFLDGENEE